MVMPAVRSSAGASAIDTRSFTPSNDSALPNRPAVDHAVPPASVPTLPFPETSAVVPPVPSAKVYAATSPLGTTQVLLTVTVTLADVA